MASPLNTAKDTVATVVAALTPPDNTNVPYRHMSTARYIPDGASADRQFWFVVSSGQDIMHMVAGGGHMEHVFELVIFLSSSGYGQDDLFERVANEAVLVSRAINKRSASWGTNVKYLRCSGYKIEAVESDDLLLRFQLACETYETD